MIVYILGTTACVLFAKLASVTNIRGKKFSNGILKLLEIFAMLPFILISASRINVGTDYAAYEQLYLHPEWFTHFSKCFMLFIHFLRGFSLNPRLFFVVTSILIYAVFTYTAFEESESAAFSLLFFVISEDFFVSMNIVSQFLAMIFIWRATAELRRNQWKKSIAFCILAAAIHPTALCFVGLIFLYKSKWSIKKIVSVAIISCIVGTVGIRYLISFIVKYSSYGRYFSTHYAVSKFSVAVPLLLIYIVIFVTAILFVDMKSFEENSRCRILIISIILDIAIMILSFGLTSNAYRFTYYFGGSIAFYLPSMLNEMKSKKNRYFIEAAILILFTVWTTMLLMHHNQNALPYQSVL